MSLSELQFRGTETERRTGLADIANRIVQQTLVNQQTTCRTVVIEATSEAFAAFDRGEVLPIVKTNRGLGCTALARA